MNEIDVFDVFILVGSVGKRKLDVILFKNLQFLYYLKFSREQN